MPFGEYALGVTFVLVVYGAAGAGGVLVVGRQLPWLAGAPRVLGVFAAAFATVVAAHLVTGALGILSRWSVAACALAALVAMWRLVPPAGAASAESRPSPPPSPRWSIAVAGLAVTAFAACLAAATWRAWATLPVDVDTLSIHLPFVGEWVRSGSLWQSQEYLALQSHGSYPQTGDVVFLSVVLPLRNDALIGLVNPAFLLIAAVAAYAICVEAGAARSTAALLAAVFGSVPALAESAIARAQTDVILLAAFGTGVLFLMRHARNGRRPELVLAGVGLGLAFGTKWYGISNVLIVLAAWAVSWLLTRRPPRALARHAVALIGLIAAFGGFWLLRNLVEWGNPVRPVEVGFLGLTIFDAPRDFLRECAGFTVADYLTNWTIWREYFLPDGLDTLGFGAVAIALGAVCVAMVAARRRRVVRGPAFLAGAAALSALAYTITPYTALGGHGVPAFFGANTRYVTPALLLGAGAAAWAVTHARVARPLLEVALAIAVVDGLRRGFDVPLAAVLRWTAALVAAAAAAWTASRAVPRVSAGTTRAVAAAGAVALVAIGLAVGDSKQRALNDDRYLGWDASLDWVLRNAPSGHRIALSGEWTLGGISFVWPSFGERLGNHVAFAGRMVDGQLRHFESRGPWRRWLTDGAYDFVLVGIPGRPGCELPGRPSYAEKWARESGFELLAESRRLKLYRVAASSS